jgi:type I restriction enzyme S subunit
MKNWELKKLGEICKFVGGSQPPKTDFTYVKKDGYIRLIQIRDYKSDSHIVYIPESKAKRFCNSTDIMIGRYGPPVFQILKGLEGAYNVALMKAVPNENLLSKDYIYLFLKYSKIQEYIIHLSQRAAGQTGVNKEAIEDYPILVPPLLEQNRIVSSLNGIFTSIDKAKANVEQNLKNVKELFDSYLHSVFENGDEGWQEKTLGEICELINRGISPKYLGNNGTIVLNQKCIRDHKISFEQSRFHDGVSKKISPEKMIRLGDVLINSTGTGTLGRVAQIKEEFKNVTVDSHVTIVRPKSGLFYLDFFGWALIFIEDEIAKRGEGCGGQTELARSTLKNDFLICFPKSLKTQQSIAGRLEILSAKTKKLEAIYQKKINNLDELKKSILQKAFNGELKTSKAVIV